MRWIIGIISLLNVWPTSGQTFNRRFDLRDNGRPQTAWGIEHMSTNNYLLIQASGETDTISPGLFFSYYAIGLTAVDGYNGDKLWDKRFNVDWHGVVPGWANCCDSLPGGGVVIGGSKQDTLQNLSAFLIVFDAQGDTVFTRDLGIPGQQWNGFSVKRTQDGGFILVGQTDATGFLDGFAIKTDALGNELWRRTYGQPAPQTDGLVHVVQLPSGDFVMSGAKYPQNNSQRRWLQRTDPLGNTLWEQLWPAQPVGQVIMVELLSDGNVITCGNEAYAPNNLQQRPYMAKVDPSDGSIIWDRLYGPIAQFNVLQVVKETPNGDLIACGVSEESGFMQGVLLRTTAQGDSIWMHKYWYQDSIYTQGTGQFYDVLPTPDGGFIATGPTYRYQPVQPNFPPGYSQDAWVVKVDADGCIVPGCNSVGITEQATNLQGALTIFPNPASEFVTLRLELPPSVAQLPLQLSVVGMDGRIAKQQVLAGNGEHTLALHGLAAGVYHIHISSEGKWLTGGKLIIE